MRLAIEMPCEAHVFAKVGAGTHILGGEAPARRSKLKWTACLNALVIRSVPMLCSPATMTRNPARVSRMR